MRESPQGTREGGLSDLDALDLLERAGDFPMAGRALALLSAVRPERTFGEWASESLGTRDEALLRWRLLDGSAVLPCLQPCPDCGVVSEFELDARRLLEGSPGRVESPREWSHGDFRLVYRIPDSADACHFGTDSAAARKVFVSRCVVSASRADVPCDPLAWPEPTWDAIESDLVSADPLAEIRLTLRCPACDRAWETEFDVAGYLWAAVSGRAREAVEHVHALAGAYGWSESGILSMSRSRRELYLRRLERDA
jgi:hypothetical protein